MSVLSRPEAHKFDRTNVVLAGLVFLGSFLVYSLTVQRTLSFWDCGEFIACSYILGIPHPPGTPLFILLGRFFSMIPLVGDISFRINYLSVFSSALTAMFSYLLTVRLTGYFFGDKKDLKINRLISYIGGIAGGFFVAFSETNWANSVEAEVYGLSLALMVMMVWLTVRYFEERGTLKSARTMILVMYLAVMGVGIHLTVYLVVPFCAIFFIIKENATVRDWLIVCSFVILELLMVIVFSNGRGGVDMFYLFSGVLVFIMLIMLYRKINWGITVAVGTVSIIMLGFTKFMIAVPLGFIVLIIMAFVSKHYKLQIRWKTSMAILLVAVIGFSTHAYIPIRSSLSPRIDENNPSRNLKSFLDYLERRQYGRQSMIDRMFERRGEWSTQFGRHPRMGFWSYFEEQYSRPGIFFTIFLLLGLLGLYVGIRKRLEIGLPFFTLLIICSVGLILYMNFADGLKYDMQTGDAYLEVRDRDYFFTPAFVFFGICIGTGVSALIMLFRDKLEQIKPGAQKTLVYTSCVLALLPVISLANNYKPNDQSNNVLPYIYAANLLDTCGKDAILFTTGDNETFPLWCLQEVYNYRRDVRVVNLSLLGTDWYVYQMKNQYDVPISLTDEQILWNEHEDRPGMTIMRPDVMFPDRPRKRMAYLQASRYENYIIRVQDMIVDEVVIENRWRVPIYFTSPPYAESPLNLRARLVKVGLLYELTRDPVESRVDSDRGFDLFMNTYQYTGLNDSTVYRDHSATRDFAITYGGASMSLINDLLSKNDRARAEALINKLMEVYPEYWQPYFVISDMYYNDGDSARGMAYLDNYEKYMQTLNRCNKDNLFYLQDLGMVRVEIGRRTNDQPLIEEGLKLMWQAFDGNSNSTILFKKLATSLTQLGRYDELKRAGRQIGAYKRNLADPYLQRLLNISSGTVPPDYDY
ncbi:MAG: protein O-mannosyl-transferase family [Candidatus Zixiibacteriota bacterium]